MATVAPAVPMSANMPSSRPKPPARVNTSSTYTLAHTAQCKLKLAAKRTDRDLRFVLGHAFTLDNLMLRIVEIENREAKSAFTEGGGKRSKDVSDAEGEHFDCSLANPNSQTTAKAEEHHDDDGDFDCTKAPPASENDHGQQKVSSEVIGGGGGRRISFQDNNARPSRNGYGSSGGSRSPGGRKRRSPSPQLVLPAGLSDDSSEEGAGTSSDDYEEPELMAYDCEAAPTVPEDKKAIKKANLLRSRVGSGKKFRNNYVDEEDAELELADDELDTNTDFDADTDKLGDDVDNLGLDDDDDDGMGLTRFESASARPPRMIEDAEGDDDDDDGEGPESPPQLPVDVDVREIIGGEKDEELTELYEKVRRCYCHGNRDNVGGPPQGIWDVPVEKTGGKRLAVVAVAA